MAGGRPPRSTPMRPILETFAPTSSTWAPSGAGHIAKLLNNFLNGISLAATAEVMLAAKLSDLDLASSSMSQPTRAA